MKAISHHSLYFIIIALIYASYICIIYYIFYYMPSLLNQV